MAPDDQVFPQLPDGTNTEMEDCMNGEYQKKGCSGLYLWQSW